MDIDFKRVGSVFLIKSSKYSGYNRDIDNKRVTLMMVSPLAQHKLSRSFSLPMSLRDIGHPQGLSGSSSLRNDDTLVVNCAPIFRIAGSGKLNALRGWN